MNVRKFWFTNGDENTFHLTDPDKNWFLADPEGLGLTINYTSIKLTDSEFINYKDYELTSINGDLIFYASTREQKYQDYFDFLRFMSKTPIYLHYQTPNSDTSYRTLVQITGLEKTEIQQDGMLHCPMSLKRQTMWYSDVLNSLVATNTVMEGKEYPLHRPYSYGAIDTSNMVMWNNGMVDAPFTLHVEGNVTDMEFSLSQDNVVYGKGKILGTYDSVFIDSDDLNETIELMIGTSVIANAVNYQDLTVGSPNEIYVTFLKLKPGKSALNFTLGSAFDGQVTVEWRNAYLSV